MSPRCRIDQLTRDAGDIDIACFRYKRSIFFDVPEDEGIRFEHPRDILAPQKRLLVLADGLRSVASEPVHPARGEA